MRLPKVTIEADNERGFKNINERDFDSKKHKLHKAKAEKKAGDAGEEAPKAAPKKKTTKKASKK